MDLFVVSKNMALTDYVSMPDEYTYEHIGFIKEQEWDTLLSKIDLKKIKSLSFIMSSGITIFNHDQLKHLEKDLSILMSHSDLDQKILTLIKQAIKQSLESKKLYLKFDY